MANYLARPILYFLCLLMLACTGQDQSKPIHALSDPDSSMAQKVEKLLQQMTLEEKVGQMNMYSGFWDTTGPAPKDGDAKKKYNHIKTGQVGAFLNVKGVQEVRALQQIAVDDTRLGIPLLFGYDVIHGHKTLYPIPLGEAASWDLEAIQRSASTAAVEASALGINWTFAPMIDISRDARWGRVMEGAGEDTYLASQIGVARIKGFQGTDLSAHNTIAATAKHFAAYGFAESGREYNTVDVGTSTLFNVILPPFEAAVDADVASVMNAFNILNGIPATGSSFLQRDILKNNWGFNGLVLSDWGSISEMTSHGFARDLAHTAQLAVQAGCDMDMESHAFIKHLADEVNQGRVNVNQIDDAVRRILTLKFELGLFDDPYKYCDEEREKEKIYHTDHLADALQMANKSIVLLKNATNLLPLNKNQTNIAVIGQLAGDKTSPLGNWRLGSDDETAISVLEGLKEYTDQVTYAPGVTLFEGSATFKTELKINETDTAGIADAVQLALSSDVVILALGEHGLQSGEARSRTNLDLPGLQQEMLEAIYAVNKNIVLVLMNGRPLTIPWADQHIPAILETWHLGTQSGHAIAQTLFGDNNPSGKLPMTFPRHVGQVPIYYNYYNTGRPDSLDIVFWSHYIDESNKPLYPFGYGLSYTQFKYSGLSMSKKDSRTFQIRVHIKNTGKYAGEEIVQLYIRDRVASVSRPIKELKGFKKIVLKPGQSKVVKLLLTQQELGFYNNTGEFIVEPGTFDIMVGPNSQEGLMDVIELE